MKKRPKPNRSVSKVNEDQPQKEDQRQDRIPRADRPPWGLLEVGAVLVFYVVSNFLLLIIFQFAGLLETRQSRLNSSLVVTVLVNLATVIVIFWLVRRRGGRLTTLGFRPIPSHLLYVPALGFLMALASLLLYAWAVGALGLKEFVPQSNMPPGVLESKSSIILFGFLAIAVAPFAEEVIIRGFLFGGLRRWLPVWAAALASGTLFGLLHGQASVIVPIAIIGVLLAFIYSVTGSIYATMLTHFFFNTVSFFATLLGDLR